MLDQVTFTTSADIDPQELYAFYETQKHHISGDAAKLERMMAQTFCFVTARRSGEIIGIARGVTDGLRGYLAECKLDSKYQGPACITKTDGRIEHDSGGIAREMALRVVESLKQYGVDRIQAVAYGTEVDFCAELGFRQASGMVALELQLDTEAPPANGAPNL